MQPVRLISRLDTKTDQLIKGIHLEGWRKLGDASEFCKKYYSEGVDEILLIDSVASLYNRDKLLKVIEKIASNVFVPITVGGGIKNCDDAYELFKSGADKIAINTGAILNPKIIEEISKNFGAQSLVLSIQAKKEGDLKWRCYYDAGREKSNLFRPLFLIVCRIITLTKLF